MNIVKRVKRGLTVSALSAVLAIAGVGMGGCTENPVDEREDEETPALTDLEQIFIDQLNQNHDSGKTIFPSMEGDDDRKAISNGEITYVGYGIDVFKGRTLSCALTYPLFDATVYNTATSYINTVNINRGEGSSTITSELKDVFNSSDIKAKFGTGDGVPFFSGSVSTQYEQSSAYKSKTQFYNSIYSMVLYKHTLDAVYYIATGGYQPDMRQLVRADYLAHIDNAATPPRSLFNAIGTHIIVESGVGGNANIAAVFNSDSTADSNDIEVALGIKSRFVNGEASVNLSAKQDYVRSNTDVKSLSNGGKANALTGVEAPHIGAKMVEWAGTVTITTATIASVDRAIPIWELASTPERRKAIQDSFYVDARTINGELANYLSKTSPTKVVHGGVYRIINKHSNMGINVANANNNTALTLWNLHGGPHMQWKAVEHPDPGLKGQFMFQNMFSNLLITPNSSDTARLHQQKASELVGQRFSATENDDGTVYLRNGRDRNTLYLCALPTIHDSTTQIHMRNMPNDNRAKWIMERVR